MLETTHRHGQAFTCIEILKDATRFGAPSLLKNWRSECRHCGAAFFQLKNSLTASDRVHLHTLCERHRTAFTHDGRPLSKTELAARRERAAELAKAAKARGRAKVQAKRQRKQDHAKAMAEINELNIARYREKMRPTASFLD